MERVGVIFLWCTMYCDSVLYFRYILTSNSELIRKEEKTIDSVPENLKQEVQQILSQESNG